MIAYSLGRPEVQFDASLQRAFYANKRVLITGAAGSVGSALALQLARYGCAHLAMLDQFDHGLLDIVEAVRRAAPRQQVTEALCDVRDLGRLDVWMRRIQPDVVIHSAALKHVHLGERHPVDCVLTNLVGVRNALAAATNAGASHFMLVSSDKAAAPVCVMGATKRLAELHLMGFQMERKPAMRVRSVRFGNVLGSQGSVLPRFTAQIEAGGPLEVTHDGERSGRPDPERRRGRRSGRAGRRRLFHGNGRADLDHGAWP
jgi:O-antigen biosynthesis protein WbqV